MTGPILTLLRAESSTRLTMSPASWHNDHEHFVKLVRRWTSSLMALSRISVFTVSAARTDDLDSGTRGPAEVSWCLVVAVEATGEC